jgi:hypothetical protein
MLVLKAGKLSRFLYLRSSGGTLLFKTFGVPEDGFLIPSGFRRTSISENLFKVVRVAFS